MANTKVTQHVIADDAITTSMITDANVTPAKLHGTLDLSSKTLTLPSAQAATTQSASDNSTKIATTAYVTTAIANLVDSSPSSLNTLNELAAALNDDASFSTTVTNSIATKLPLAGGTMTGNIAHASNFTIDVGGDIILDAGGANINFNDDGTAIGHIEMAGQNLEIKSKVSDKDIFFKGNDGGSAVTALTLDMSEAGFATFNDGGVFGGTGALRIPQGTTGQRPTAATGQIRWNTTDGALEVYNGSAWVAVGTGSSNKILDTFTGDNSTTDFTLSETPANEDALMVFIDGVYQEKGDYVLTNAVLALDTAPASGEKIAVHITTASVHDGTSATNQQFTATAGQTAFTLSADPKSENNTQVYINGVYQQKTDYTVSGTTLTFDTGLTVGDVVEVNAFTVATLGNTDTVSEGTTNLYHTTARARGAISVSGNALSYNSSTGVITSAYEESPVFTGNVTLGSSTAGNLLVGSANSFQIQKSGVTGYINQSDSGPIIVRMGSGFSEKLRIGPSGQIGIGGANYGTDGQILTSTGASTAPAWEDIPSDMVVSSSAPSSPSQGDMWFNSSASTVSDIPSKVAAVYDGTRWQQLSSKFSATGGTITTDGNYTVHTFTSSGTFTATGTGDVEYLVIAGGGSGGAQHGGGGGAGGYRTATGFTVTEGNYSITVGAGGASVAGNASPNNGNSGTNSVFSTITSLGGGWGQGWTTGGTSSGGSGGSGGGASLNGSGGAGTSGQGYAGGSSSGSSTFPNGGGGGGGSSSVGENSTNLSRAGNGGSGTASSITGSSVTRAGGGGGGSHHPHAIGTGGSGGGGNGGLGNIAGGTGLGVAGTTNTGSGGGGSGANTSASGAGGSGIVIVRYLT